MKVLAALCMLALPLAACGQEPSPGVAAAPTVETASPAGVNTPYAFDQPVASFTLPDELKEISALTVLDDGRLGAVQDEEGRLYVIGQETGAVEAVVPFGPPGDYEGIELAAGRLFVLRADGVLFEVEGWEGGEARAREYATGLPKKCDAEGLGFDEAQNRLLIACKNEGGEGLGNQTAIHAFDLGAMALASEPAFVIDPNQFGGKKKLRASALAVHPVTGHVVVLSAARKALIALGPDGAVAETWDLEPAGFEQPEGLTFLPNGDVFIASEGDKRAPVLQRFAYQPAP